MKKIIFILALLACIALALSTQTRSGDTMFVSTRNLELKSSTGFFSNTTAQLDYGAQVSVVQVNGDWAEVRSTANAALSGWTRTTNLTSRRIVQSSASATAQEVALAGKGFNQGVENSFRAQGNLNYADVDRMEAQQVNRQELHAFLVEGRLSLGDR